MGASIKGGAVSLFCYIAIAMTAFFVARTNIKLNLKSRKMKLTHSCQLQEDFSCIDLLVDNPFTGKQVKNYVIIQHTIQWALFGTLKGFIIEQLEGVKRVQIFKQDKEKCEALQSLIPQIFPNSTLKALLSKLLEYKKQLGSIPEYNQIINYLKSQL